MEPQLPLLTEGPFVGMLANSQVEIPPGHFSFLQNVYLRDGEAVGRSGLQKLATARPAKIQGVYQWEMLSGVTYTVVFSNGDMYVYDWVAGTYTFVDLSTFAVTLSTTSGVECATSRGRLVFTDGVNKPVMAVGPLASIAFTTLTEAPVARRLGIYYDKVFFWDIPGYENEFQWSDEANPLLGYAAKDQAWEFAQTDAGRLIGMAPLNERMVILKEDSATMLMGSANENFSTLAVREGLSETEGAVAGGSVAIFQGDVFCMSANGPRIIQGGQKYVSLHDAGDSDYLRDILDTVNRSQMDKCLSWVDKERGHIGWLMPFGTSSDLNVSIVFDARRASWTTFKFGTLNITACGSVEDNTGQEWVLFGDSLGNVYKYRTRVAVYSDDTEPIEIIIQSRLLGAGQPSIQKRLTEVSFYFNVTTDFYGTIEPYIDGEIEDGKVFGVHDTVGKRRYRRGFNHIGYLVGWRLYAKALAQTITLKKTILTASAIGAAEDWDA